ncbi:TlpA family protein disulfide reductase [uncultured Sphingomonas sp.]|uniref:TlpA family protein disulfide reductase n=1 Tax=uncultured Sphingomonas sp. TaxID=158754 RepID=UPI0035CBF6D6
MRAIVFLLAATAAIGGCDRRSPPNGQATDTVANVAADAETTPDEVVGPPGAAAAATGKVDRGHQGEAAPKVAFTAPDGKTVTLASFAGRPVLLNLWATWCGPCVAEMPTLDILAGEGNVTIVALSQDLDGAKAVAPFVAREKLKALRPYLDPALKMSAALGNPNLPTTILYDAKGREMWRVAGGLDWTGMPARTLLAEAN